MTPVDMIISHEQAQLALRLLSDVEHRGLSAPEAACDTEVPQELLHRVNAMLSDLPEMREDRVEKARADLASGAYSSEEVADKIIARAITDTLR